MKKLYPLLLIFLFSKMLYSQQAVIAIEVPGSGYQFVYKKTGEKVNDYLWQETERFVNGFAKVAAANKWGYVDVKGNPVIGPAYESVRNFVNDVAAVKQHSKWGFINKEGTPVIPFEYDIVYDFKEKVTAVYKNNQWFLINKNATVVKALDIDIFWGFKNGSARITRNGHQGIMNIRGEIISMEPEKKDGSKKINPTPQRPVSLQAATPCPDNIGFERGNFTNWDCFTGDVAAVGTTNVITVNPSPPTANRHVIYPATNPSGLDPYGLFPINPPDGSGYALKLGNNVNGAEAERVTYQINVPANAEDASITYRYAVVFQDPGHLRYQQPRFSAKLLDVETNKYLTCASYEYVSDDTIPGFYSSTIDDSVKCKTWASVFINLSAYAGKTLLLEFTTADCTRGAHWGYTYVDVGDCNVTAGIEYQCNPNIATLTGPPGFRRYKWWNTDYTNLLGQTKNVLLNPAPTITSTLHVEVIPYNGASCSDTLHVAVVNRTPTADAGPHKVICSGASARIGTPAIAGNIYSWAPSAYLSNAGIASPVSTPPVTTTYIVTMTNIANGCIDYDTVTVAVNPTPDALFDPGPAQCLTGNSFAFVNNSVAGSLYQWSFGDGDSAAQVNPVHVYKNAQTYLVKMVVTAGNGCMDSITHPVIVNPDPVVRTNDDLAICRGKSVQLKTTGAQLYEWTPVQDLSCSDCANPIASPQITTTYIVKGTNSFGCIAYDTINIEVFQPIEINVSPGAEICAKESIHLMASGADTYKWSPAQSLSNATIAGPIATPSVTTEYRVIGYDGNNCFSDTGYVTIVVNPNPTIQLGPDLLLPTGAIYPFNPVTTKGPFVSWQWLPATNLSCTSCPDPSATIKKDITYHVLLENVFGCRAVDSINIRTFCESTQVFIPNAFSPDGDGINDILMVRAKGIEYINSFRIFSRWGELIFEKNNFPPNSPAHGWDGKIKGVTGPAEVYVYTAEVTCDNLQTYTFKGNISILK
jgi:gliding motility-associated-like protein